MTPASFRDELKGLGLSLTAFADKTGVNLSTAKGWGHARPGRGVQAFPQWVPLLIQAWKRTGVPRRKPRFSQPHETNETLDGEDQNGKESEIGEQAEGSTTDH